MKRDEVFISFGSNTGNKTENCLLGLKKLSDCKRIELISVSRLYITEPVGFSDQDWFINGVARLCVETGPFELLQALESVQNEMGRKRNVRFGPRRIDIDILYFNDLLFETEKLVLPHPRMHERCFVLRPLCDIAPDSVHPLLKMKACEMLKALDDKNEKVYLYR